jgi:hypothetical protein
MDRVDWGFGFWICDFGLDPAERRGATLWVGREVAEKMIEEIEDAFHGLCP